MRGAELRAAPCGRQPCADGALSIPFELQHQALEEEIARLHELIQVAHELVRPFPRSGRTFLCLWEPQGS